MEPVYDVDYFIRKFEAIPEDNWWIGEYNDEDGNRFCAYGHCGLRSKSLNRQNKEADALYALFCSDVKSIVADINDGKDIRYLQPTPKQRILAALYDIKANQMLEVARDIIIGAKQHDTELV